MSREVRCSICGGKAVAVIHYARLRLCRKHFMEFIERKVERAIRRYRLISNGQRVLAAVSGGKDSSTLLAVLSKLSSKLGFEVIALHINLGIGEYSEKSLRFVRDLARVLGARLVVIDVKEAIGYSIPELAARLRRPICSVCGLVKRYVINAAAIEARADVVALGHNLDDLVAYVLKEFLSQNLQQITKLGPKTESIDGLAVGRVRPLYEVLEKESLIYALVSKVPFIPDECPHVRLSALEFKIKDLMNKLDSEFPGIKISLARRLAKNLGYYPTPEQEVRKCDACRLLASTDLCSFCKATKRVAGSPKGADVREYIRGKLKEAGIL